MINTPTDKEIGARLLQIRKAFFEGTQRQWAERHGFSPTQYNNWETGTRRITIDCAARLCEAYGLTLDFIYLGRVDGLSQNSLKVLTLQ